MALAIRLGRLSSQLPFRNKLYLYSASRCYSDDIYKKRLPWNYIWKPTPYSEKDHDKIAEKYQMHPKDYKPYPNNERFTADYPALPMVGPAAKDPDYPYDIPVYRKNYHEPLHDQFEIMGEDRYSFGYKYRIDPAVATSIFLLVMIVSGAIFYITLPYPKFQPLMEKQYPDKGKVHYTFESAE